MPDIDPNSPVDPSDGPSPGTAAWVARRDAVRRAASADRIRAEDASAGRESRLAEAPQSRVGVLIGFAVIAVVLALCLVVIHQMHCDPLFSDRGLSRPGACN